MLVHQHIHILDTIILIIINEPHLVAMHNKILNLDRLHAKIQQQPFNDLINSTIYFSCTMVQ